MGFKIVRTNKTIFTALLELRKNSAIISQKLK